LTGISITRTRISNKNPTGTGIFSAKISGGKWDWDPPLQDPQLKWNRHNDEQCNKISKSIALLRKAKDFASQEELGTIFYNSLVLPHFNYCSTIWNDNNKSHISNIDKLWKLQKRASRVITSSDCTIRSSQVFETLQ
jgi:hypothetical protein